MEISTFRSWVRTWRWFCGVCFVSRLCFVSRIPRRIDCSWYAWAGHTAPVHRATLNCLVPKKLGLFSYEQAYQPLRIGSFQREVQLWDVAPRMKIDLVETGLTKVS